MVETMRQARRVSARREKAGDHRHERRRDRARRDELEDQVRDAECGEEGVELRARAEASCR